MKIALYVVVALVALVLVIVVIGYSLPQSHTASRHVTVPAPPDKVFTLIATPRDYPKWRHDVDSVEMLPPAGTGTVLRITEDGEVYNPIFRFMSRFVFGHTATLDQYLGDVERESKRGS